MRNWTTCVWSTIAIRGLLWILELDFLAWPGKLAFLSCTVGLD